MTENDNLRSDGNNDVYIPPGVVGCNPVFMLLNLMRRGPLSAALVPYGMQRLNGEDGLVGIGIYALGRLVRFWGEADDDAQGPGKLVAEANEDLAIMTLVDPQVRMFVSEKMPGMLMGIIDRLGGFTGLETVNQLSEAVDEVSPEAWLLSVVLSAATTSLVRHRGLVIGLLRDLRYGYSRLTSVD